MNSNKEWSQFIAALEGKHVSFDQVKLTSDPRSVIGATGFTDPLTAALIETEWKRQLQQESRKVNVKSINNSNNSSSSENNKSVLDKRDSSTSPLSHKQLNSTPNSAIKSTKQLEMEIEEQEEEEEQHYQEKRKQKIMQRSVNHTYGYNDTATINNRHKEQWEQQQEELKGKAEGVLTTIPSQLPTCLDYNKIAELPDEVQDSVVANEVVMAALGFSGSLLSFQSSTHSFSVTSLVPLALRSLCQSIIPVANAFLRLQAIEAAEYTGQSLIVMALGEVVSEICTSYVEQMNAIHPWCTQRVMPLLTVVSEIMRIGHPIIRLEQLLPFDLLVRNHHLNIVTTTTNTNSNNINVQNVQRGNVYRDAAQLIDTTPLQLQNSLAKRSATTKSPLLDPISENRSNLNVHTNNTNILHSTAATSKATQNNKVSFVGPRLLNHLFAEARKCKGSREDDALLTLLIRRSMLPFLHMLYRWMHEGVIDDPLHEFFISENSSLANQSSFSSSSSKLLFSHNAMSSVSNSLRRVNATTTATANNNNNNRVVWSQMSNSSSKLMQQRKLLANLFPNTSLSGYTSYNNSGNNNNSSSNSNSYNIKGNVFADSTWSSNVNQQASAVFERRFGVNKVAIPDFLLTPSNKIVKKVLFAGKYCCLLRECGEDVLLTPRAHDRFIYNANRSTMEDKSILQWTSEESLFCLIEYCFERASNAVIRLLLGPSVNLLAHLSALKALFLHERGDCITDFLESTELLLHQTCDQVKVYSLRVSLHAAIARCLSANTSNVSFYSVKDAPPPSPPSLHTMPEMKVNVQDLFSCSFADYTIEQYVTRHAATSSTINATSSSSTNAATVSNKNNNHHTVNVDEQLTSSRSLPSSVQSFSPIREQSVNNIGSKAERDNRKSVSANRASIERCFSSKRCVEMLQLEADLQWPLTLVLDASVMQRFNVIFRLLLWIRSCERELCNVWFSNAILAEFNAAYGLKHQFIQFLRQFQFHAVHVVLEPLWEQLMNRVKQATNVFAITAALHDFFDEVEVGLVLSNEMRFRSLATILELMSRFCNTGNQYNSHISTTTTTTSNTTSKNNKNNNMNEVTMPLIDAALQSIQESFAHALSELASPIGSDYNKLLPLLSEIDFNNFYHRHNVFHIQGNKAVVSQAPLGINELSSSTLLTTNMSSSASSSTTSSITLEPEVEINTSMRDTNAIATSPTLLASSSSSSSHAKASEKDANADSNNNNNIIISKNCDTSIKQS